MFKYSSSSSVVESVPKSSNSSKKLSRVGPCLYFIEYNGLESGGKGNALKSNLKIARKGRIPSRCEACSMMTTALGEQYVPHLSILQASSLTGNMTACILDGALIKDISQMKRDGYEL